MSNRALRKLQLGRETTAGNAISASVIWSGKGTILDTRTMERVQQDVGIIGGTDQMNVTELGGKLAISQTPATFEQILHILEMTIKTVSGSQDGAGSGYVYTYPFPTTAANTIKTYTIEGGDDQQEEEMAYCFGTDFSLTGDGRNAYQLSANIIGREVTPSNYTNLSTLTAVNYMNFGMTKFYIDAIGGSYGSTLVSSTVRKIDFRYTSGNHIKNTADGRLDFSFVNTGADYSCLLMVEFEHNSTATGAKVDWRALTARKIRVKIEGDTAFAQAGTTYSKPTLLIDLPGRWSNFEKINEQNGNDVVQGSFLSAYNTTAGGAGTITVVAAVATIP